MLNIGCHLSAAGGYLRMGQDALTVHANTFQYFSRNPRGGAVRSFDPEDACQLMELMKSNSFASPLTHAPYTLNPCAQKPETLSFARQTLREDLERLEFFENPMYNLHPGSHTGAGTDEGIRVIAQTLNECMFDGQKTRVLLETMAGKGTEVGKTFEEIRRILDLVQRPEKMGVCLDTCHVYDAGYDIVRDLDGVLEEFDRVIGLEFLYALHINDSKFPIGSRKDRHEKLGQGCLGPEIFAKIVRHPFLSRKPMYLETPNELDGYREEIDRLREAAQ